MTHNGNRISIAKEIPMVMNELKTMPLTMVFPGKKVKVISLAGGIGLGKHLADMGLSIGSEIEVFSRGTPGPFIIGVKETRLAIGFGMARKIIVEEE